MQHCLVWIMLKKPYSCHNATQKCLGVDPACLLPISFKKYFGSQVNVYLQNGLMMLHC